MSPDAGLSASGATKPGPPVDDRLVCGAGEDAPLVGRASLVEGELHVALIDGALAACEGVGFGVAGGEIVFQVTSFVVEGRLGAQENRADAFRMAEEARARSGPESATSGAATPLVQRVPAPSAPERGAGGRAWSAPGTSRSS